MTGLDLQRFEEQLRVREETESRLRDRGIKLHPWDGDEEAEDLLDAIERFEVVVDSETRPPPRDPEETIGDYCLRIEAATDRLRRNRP